MNFLYFSLVFWSIVLFVEPNPKTGTSGKKDVVIVGGGMAGMAAARRLLKDGNFNVKVLEARSDRYGGRIFTNRQIKRGVKGIDVELGASFLNTRDKDNELIKLAEEFELHMESSGSLQVHVINENAENLVYSGSNATDLYGETFKTVIEALRKAKQDEIDRPVRDILLEAVGVSGEQTENELTVVQKIVKSLPAVTMQNFSTALYNIETEFGWDKQLVDGVDVLLDRIVAGSGMELPIKLELNKVVRNVKIDDKRGKVLIRTMDRKQVIADAVIVALPIGVLKSGNVIFDPRLSTDWYKAVENIGIGYCSKVIVGFKEAFWPKDVGTFNVFSSLASDGFLQMWTNAYRISGNPFLIGHIFGHESQLWEKRPEKDLKEIVTMILSGMFGEETVNAHEMTTFVHSNWSTDEYTLGSVSYPRVGNQPDLWKILQQPVCPYIYFAGAHLEAGTHVDSLHGAYNSGLKAAEQIINNKCKMKKSKAKNTTDSTTSKVKKKDEL